MDKTNKLFGIPIDRVTTRDVLQKIEDFIKEDKPHQIVYINVDCINKCFFDKKYRKIIEEADLVYADGMGIVHASKLFGSRLPERVNAGDFLPDLCNLCVDKGYKIFLLGGGYGIVEKMEKNLLLRFPGLQIVGRHHGFFADIDEDKIIEMINKSSPDILLVGMGAPKQEKWIKKNLKYLNVPICWGVGGLFDYYAEKVKRAPIFIRKIGFEWLFRLCIEPKRLWKRYLLGNVFFALRLFLLVILDIVFISLGWISSYHIRYKLNRFFTLPINPFPVYLRALPGVLLIWIVLSSYFGLYKQWRQDVSKIEQFSALITTIFYGLLICMSFSFLFKELQIGRSIILFSCGMNLFLLSLSRSLVSVVERAHKQDIKLKRALIIGTGRLADAVWQEVENSPLGYEVVGFLQEDATRKESNKKQKRTAPIIGTLSELREKITEENIDEVFVASSDISIQDKLNLIARQNGFKADFKIVSGAFLDFSRRVHIDKIADVPLLDLSENERNNWYEYSKIIMDTVIASVLLLLSFPLWVIIALAIKFDSKGPVFFKQQRVGKDGNYFIIYKFRTMYTHTPSEMLSPNNPHDPRITRVGKFLRAFSLDELPQFVNVIQGDMSLVGPRPEMPFIVKKYEFWERERTKVRPGITGLWQIVGRKDLPLQSNLEYDFYYIKHRSLLMDIAVIVKTIPAVLFRRGAF
ncbi:MAG: exopolysaccharide biosynthesis polyprenyl glycosylphosphotransferase [bacterium]